MILVLEVELNLLLFHHLDHVRGHVEARVLERTNIVMMRTTIVDVNMMVGTVVIVPLGLRAYGYPCLVRKMTAQNANVKTQSM